QKLAYIVLVALILALCLAIVSALTNRPLPADLVVFGEVGLAGELRQAGHAPRRLAEAARLGFRRAVVPANTPDGPSGITPVRVATLSEAILAAGLGGGRAS
ncbi:MAG: S16 family serine protease, partial [Actinomycetota bacterium]